MQEELRELHLARAAVAVMEAADDPSDDVVDAACERLHRAELAVMMWSASTPADIAAKLALAEELVAQRHRLAMPMLSSIRADVAALGG